MNDSDELDLSMRLFKFALFIIVATIMALSWYQWSYVEKWERLIYPLEYRQEIATAAEKHSIDPYLICAIIYVESKFNPFSESQVGAVGLMQIMPDTGNWIAKKQGRNFETKSLYDPQTNIEMGCWYFNYLRSKYGNEKLALAAYNSGDKNVDRWLRTSNYGTVDKMVLNIPYEETRNFIQRVEEARQKYGELYAGEFTK